MFAFDTPAGILMWISIAVMWAGAIILLTSSRLGWDRRTGRAMLGLVIATIGLGVWNVAMWLDGTGWLPGRVISSVFWLVLVLIAARQLLRWRARRLSDATEQDRREGAGA